MIRRRKGFALLLVALSVILGMTATDAFQGSPAHAQTDHNGRVTLTTTQAEVYEGGAVVMTLTRIGGPIDQPVTARIQSAEDNRIIGHGNNPSTRIHRVTIEPGENTATLTFTAYVDGISEPGFDPLHVQIQTADNGYQTGFPYEATVEINDPPASAAILGLTSAQGAVAEGGQASFTITRSGDVSSDLTVNLRYDDPYRLLRGNHRDPAPSLPTVVTMQAGATSLDVTVPVPDDDRDMGIEQSFALHIVPSDEYLLGNVGLETRVEATVTDDDTAQELELNFGKNGVNDADADEGDTLAFVVKRRQQDADNGQPAELVVRVETDRTGPDRLLDDWTEDSSTGRLFKEYPIELSGSDTEVRHEIEVIENGAAEGNWSYWASIEALEDVDGNPIIAAQESEYWTVKSGFRDTTIDVTDSGAHTGTVYLNTDQTEVYEGAAVLFTITRSGGPMGRALLVQVGARDLNPDNSDHAISTYYYFATVEPWESTITLNVLALVDELVEEDDANTLEVFLSDLSADYLSGTTDAVVIDINDQPDSIPIVDVAFNSASVNEGENAVFTLTRSGDTSSEVTVHLRYEDSFEMLRGNHWEPPPALPTAVTIPAGATAHEVAIPVPDDQRDVPGERRPIRLEILPSDGYLIGGLGLGTLTSTTVVDNDEAQELEFWWGTVGSLESVWEDGQDWITCEGEFEDSCTPGPAEGIFHFDDARDFSPRDRLHELAPAHFGIIRRAEDVGKTATFVVRVEHNRGWESPRHAHWPVDPVTGNHYFEFPLTLTGNQRQVVGRIELLDNGLPDPVGWEYSAEIKRIEDVSNGTVLEPDQEAQYWTVSGTRSETIQPADQSWPAIYLLDATPDPVMEGGQTVFTILHVGGNALEPLTIRVRTWEPNRLEPGGDNPTEQIHEFTVTPVPLTPFWVPITYSKFSFPVTVTDDLIDEDSDVLLAEVIDNAPQYQGNDGAYLVDIVDDDSAGVTVRPTAITAVSGRSNEYSLELDSMPLGDVTVTIGGAAGTDLLVDSSSLTFTPENWSTAQTVSVTALKDAAPGTVTLTHTVSSIADIKYDSVSAEDAVVTIFGAPGTPLLQLGVAEPDQDLTVAEGGSGTYSIVLGSRPAGDVTVDIGGVPGTDLTLDTATLTFTAGNWSIPQVVTVTAGQDDDVVNDDVTLTHSVSSADDDYDGLNAGNVVVTVADDDTPQLTVNFEQDTYTVTEGDSVIVKVILSGDPKRAVDVPINVARWGGASDADYVLSDTLVSFDSGETFGEITFSAADDSVDDDGESVRLSFGKDLPAGVSVGSTSASFVSIDDEDGPPVTVSFEHDSYAVLEGDWVEVTVVLDDYPEREVSVPLTATASAGTTSDDYSGVPSSVTFGSGERRTSFIISAAQDTANESGEYVTVRFGSALPYGVFAGSPDRARVSISDERTTHIERLEFNGEPKEETSVAGLFHVGIHFEPSARDLALEDLEITGGTAQGIEVRPRGSTNFWHVQVLVDESQLSRDDDKEGATVTVRVPEDIVDGGNPAAEVTYDVTPSFTVELTNKDQEPVKGSFEVSVSFGEDVTELDDDIEGDSEWYFSTKDDLVVTNGDIISSQMVSDRDWLITVQPESGATTVTITLPYARVATGSNTGVWNQEASLEVQSSVRSVDFKQSAYTVDEGESVTVTVTLNADPLSTVEIPLSVKELGETGAADYSGIPPGLTFNSGEIEKTFTFLATDDHIDDDGDSVVISIGSPLPEGIILGSSTQAIVSITDNDGAGVDVSETSLDIEEGASADYTVVLTSEPAGDVRVAIEVASDAELTLDTDEVTFTADDWDTPQTVTVTADHDDDAVAEPLVTITHTSSSAIDSLYHGMGVDGVDVNVSEDDRVGITLTRLRWDVLEGDDLVAVLTLVLDSEPTDTVTIDSAGTYLFTPQNWNIPQSGYIQFGEDTNTQDESWILSRSPARGGDYEGVSSPTMRLGVIDNDPVIRYSLSEIEPVDEDVGTVRGALEGVTNEDGVPSQDYKIRLHTTPGSAEAGSDYERVDEVLVFAEEDFEEFVNSNGETRYRQTVYFDIAILDDATFEPSESFELRLSTPKEHRWPRFGNRRSTVSIDDDDTAGVTISESELQIDEEGSGSYTVVLDSEPTHDVTVTVGGFSGTDAKPGEGEDELTFTADDWDTPQTVTVTAGADDDVTDEDDVTLTHTVSSDDDDYDGISAADVVVKIKDNDPDVEVRFGEATYSVAESDDPDTPSDVENEVTVTVVLSADPKRTVQIPITAVLQDDASLADYSLSDDSVTFTTGEVSKEITFTATADSVDDDGESVKLTFTSPLPEGVTAGSPSETVVSIVDDDTAGVTISESELQIDEEGSGSYTVVLDSEPAHDVTVTVGGFSGTDAKPGEGEDELTFTADDWNTPQTVTVTAGADDDVTDEDDVTLTHTVSSSDDDYDGLSAADVVVKIKDNDPDVVVRFGQATYSVAESDDPDTPSEAENEVTVTVVLSADPKRTVQIPITAVLQDDASLADYSLSDDSVTFTTGEVSKEITFTATADSVDDDGESVKLTFTSPLPDGVTAGTPAETVVSITDDDAPSSLTVNFGAGTYTVAEGGEVTVTVTLNDDPERTVEIPVTAVAQGDTSESDYTFPDQVVTFTSGVTSREITFSARQDNVAEGDEEVKLTFDGLPSDVSAGSTEETTVTITNVAPQTSLIVSFGVGTYSVAESDDPDTPNESENEVTVTVSLNTAPGSELTIPITVTAQGDASTDDYELSDRSVTFGASDTSQQITFTAKSDSVDDDGESVRLTFTSPLPAGVTEGATKETVVSIDDDDTAGVTISESELQIDEEGSGSYTVVLDSEPAHDVTVTVGGFSGTDASPGEGEDELTFTADDWDTPQTVTVTAGADDDVTDEDDVTLTHTVSSSDDDYDGLSAADVVVKIKDNDPDVEVRFGEATYSVAESDDPDTPSDVENEVTVTVVLSADPKRTVQIPITAVLQDDASLADYSLSDDSVTFTTGEVSKEITFTATADSVDDDGESVKLTFTSPLPEGVTAGSPSETVVSIVDDDTAGVTISESELQIDEEGSGSYTVVLDSEPAHDVTVTVGGFSGTDAKPGEGEDELTFTADDWNTPQTVTVTAGADDDVTDEDDVTLTHTVSSSDDDYDGLSAADVVVKIKDNDPDVVVRFGQATYSVAESDDPDTPSEAENEVTVTVVLSADPKRTVQIPITAVLQDDASLADYSLSDDSVTFTTGEVSKEITFTATADSVDDDGESVKLTFTSPLPDGVTAGTPAETVVSITDDDAPSSLTVNFGAGTYTVAEGGEVTVTVTLNDDPERTVEIPVTAVAQGDTSESDYTFPDQVVTFTSGVTSREITFSARQDNVAEGDEEVKLTFDGLPSDVSAGSTEETTVTITNVAPQTSLIVSFGVGTYSVAESDDPDTPNESENEVTVTVSLNTAPGSELTIPITVTAQGDASTDDYELSDRSVTFGASDTSQQITFTAKSDSVDDDGESVRLTFTSPLPAGVTEGATKETVVSIDDDDTAGVTISESELQIDEEGSGSYTVVLDSEPAHDVTVTVGGFSGTDASPGEGEDELTFTADDWDTPQTVTVTAGADDDVTDEDDVTLTHTVSSSDDDYDGLSAADVVVKIKDNDPDVEVRFGEATYSVAESDDPDTPSDVENEVTVTVVLSADPKRTVQIPITAVLQDDASLADYSLSDDSVTFTTGEVSKEITFTATADSVDDDGESVKLTFTSPLPEGVTAGSPSETVVSIVDDDTAGVTISESELQIDEEGSGSYTVVLDSEPAHDVTVTVGGFSGTDASPGEGEDELTFTADDWDTPQTVTVTAGADDDVTDEDDVTLTHTVSSSDDDYDGLSAADVVVKIKDNDPDVEVRFGEATYSVAESDDPDTPSDVENEVTVTVVLSADPKRTVQIPITAVLQDDASLADYSLSDDSVTFTTGEVSKEITFTATADSVDDDGESVKLTFTSPLPDGVTAGTPAETVVSITDDDAPSSLTVNFGAGTYTVAEGGEVTVTVTLNDDPERTVEIPVTAVAQGDTSESDYTFPDQVVTFTSGVTSREITFSARQDNVAEGDEEVKLTFDGLPSDVSAGSTEETTVTITNVAPQTSLIVSFGVGTYSVAESDDPDTPNESENEVTVTVSLNTAPGSELTIPITVTAQGDASTDDYELSDRSVTFGASDTSQQITFTAKSDSVDDDGESVRLTFTSPLPEGVTAGTPAETVVSITDDDAPSSLTVNFGAGTYTVAEGGTVTVTVTLSDDPERTVEIPVTAVAQGDTSESDYTFPDQVVTFTSGVTSREITFSARQDNVAEGDEEVKLTFDGLPSDVSAGSTEETTVTITNVAPQTSLIVSFGVGTYRVDEGAEAQITVSLNTAPGSELTIPITVTAQGDASTDDYELSARSVTFGASDTSGQITFTAKSDDVDDDNESVRLTFTSPLPAGVTEGATKETVVSIDDDDTAGVTISESELQIDEEGSGSYTVVLDSEPAHDVTVTVGGFSGTDASPGEGEDELTFTADDWDTPQTVTVTAGADDDVTDEDDVTLTHTVSSSDDDYDGLSAADVVVKIKDNDPDVEVRFGEATYSVAESDDPDTPSDVENEVTVTVVLSADPKRTVQIPITAVLQDDASLADYSLSDDSVTFTTGEVSKEITFTATADSVDDDGESVKLTFTSPLPEGVTAGSPSETVVSIVDDDAPNDGEDMTVSYETSTYELREGSTTEITVVLSEAPEAPLTIVLTTSNHSGTTADDYSGIPLSVNFEIGETKRPLAFTAIQDLEDESTEVVTLGFDALPTGIGLGAPSETTVSILDSHRVFFSAGEYEAYEGGTGDSVAVYIDSAVTEETIIPIIATAMNGATEDDWTGVPDELFFIPGQRNGYFTVIANDDDVEDDGEMVLLEFGDLPAGFVAGTPSTATVELMNMENGVAPECDNSANRIIVLDRVGSIDTPGETDFWTIALDPHRFYLLEVIGPNDGRDILGEVTYSGTLTLEDPDVIGIWSFDNSKTVSIFTQVIDDYGGGTDTLMLLASSDSAAVNIEVGSSNGGAADRQVADGTGRYQIKVRVSNICHVENGKVEYRYAGGPDGYPLEFDEPADTSTDDEVLTVPFYEEPRNSGGFLGNHGGDDRDVDWFRVELHSDYQYTIEVRTPTIYPERHQATDLKILGIYDEIGTAIGGTSSSTSGMNVSVDFRPAATGIYHISVGSDGSDHTGVYGIRVTGELIAGKEEPEWTLPPAPQNLRAIANEDGSVFLTWEATGDDRVESYQILRHRPTEGENTPMIRLEDTVSLDTSYTDLYVTPGVLHIYYVKAINNAGISERSNEAEVIPLTSAEATGTPTNTPASGTIAIFGDARVGEILLAAQAITDADGLQDVSYSYQWIRGDGADRMEIPGATGFTYTLVDADAGHTITVRVDFTDDAGNYESLTSPPTEPVEPAVTESADDRPVAVTGVTVIAGGAAGELVVAWDAHPDGPSQPYRVALAPVGGSFSGGGDTTWNAFTGDTTVTFTGLEPGGEYKVKVRARFGAGNKSSEWSAEVTGRAGA